MHRRGATESSASGPRGTRATRETKELNPKTRLVIRRLPPGLSSSTFHDALASKSCPCQLGTVEFVAGSESKAYMGSSRAYVTLGGWEERANASSSNSPSQASSTVSAQKFKQWVEGSMNADVFGNAVVVGYAAYRPGADPNEDLAGSGGEMGQVNELDGTLEESDVYKTFIERFEREKREQEEGGKPVTVGLEVRGEVQKTSLMEFVERKFRKNQRPKTTKAKVRKGKSEGRDGRAVQAGQGGQTSQARGKSQPQKGRGGGRGSGRGRGGGGQKGRKGQGPVAQGAGSLPSKDLSAQAGRPAKGQSQASVSGKNPPVANAASGDSKPRGTKPPRRGRKGGKAAEGAAPKGTTKINILNPNAASFA